MATADLQMDARDWTRLVVLSVLWGATFFFTGVALKELPPLTLVFLRLSIATLILLPVVWISSVRWPKGVSGWWPYVVMAFINNAVPFSLIVMGQTYIPSGLASVINATTPVFTVLIAAAFGAERLIWRRVAGVLIGLLGVVILRGFDFDIHSRQTIGIMLGLGATVCFGSPRCGRRAGFPMQYRWSGDVSVDLGELMMLVLSFAVDRPWQLQMPGLVTWAAILGLRRRFPRARLYHLFPDHHAVRSEQRGAGDPARSRQRASARVFILHEQIVAREIAARWSSRAHCW